MSARHPRIDRKAPLRAVADVAFKNSSTSIVYKLACGHLQSGRPAKRKQPARVHCERGLMVQKGLLTA